MLNITQFDTILFLYQQNEFNRVFNLAEHLAHLSMVSRLSVKNLRTLDKPQKKNEELGGLKNYSSD